MTCVFPTATEVASLLSGLADFLKAIAWPIVAWLVIWRFRNEISSLLTRILEFSLKGAKWAPPPAHQQPQETTPDEQPKGLKPAVGESSQDPLALDPALKRWRDHIEQYVAKLTMDEASVRSYLISSVAWYYRSIHFYNTLRLIYGSQIELVTRLKGQLVSVKEAREVYQTIHVERSLAEGAVPFDRWIGFLVQHSLILASPKAPSWNDADLLTVTYDGQEFAKFLLEAGETANTRWY